VMCVVQHVEFNNLIKVGHPLKRITQHLLCSDS
jgi:hypothetical protein